MMKKLLIICLLTLLGTKGLMAQTASVNVTIDGSVDYKDAVWVSDETEPFNLEKTAGRVLINLDANRSGSYTFKISQPHYVRLIFPFFKEGRLNTLKWYVLFISPGDNLFVTANFDKKDGFFVVKGKGSNNNQPEIAPLTDVYKAVNTRDTIVTHAMATINKEQEENRKILADYIAKYKPSVEFVKVSRINIEYYAAVNYYMLKAQRLGLNDPTGEKHPEWQSMQDSLFATIKLNNDDALIAFNYLNFVSELVLRLKEKSWEESRTKPEEFYREWYDTTVTEGKKLFTAERKNLFIEKVINKNFSGKTAEYLYANLLEGNLNGSNIQNLDVIFEHFKHRYPQSKYITFLSAPIAAATNKANQLTTDKMVFVTNNGTQLNSFDEVLALTKGHTVLIDMWGTWCEPCRAEIEANSAALKAQFKNRDVVFMYVANQDLEHEKAWKELISYFHLEGTHILANNTLTQDIMKKAGGSGFPTYIIVKKDGTYSLAKTQNPVDRAVMIKELEDALAMKD